MIQQPHEYIPKLLIFDRLQLRRNHDQWRVVQTGA